MVTNTAIVAHVACRLLIKNNKQKIS